MTNSFNDDAVRRIARQVTESERRFRNKEPKRRKFRVSGESSALNLVQCQAPNGISGRSNDRVFFEECRKLIIVDRFGNGNYWQLKYSSEPAIEVYNPHTFRMMGNGSKLGIVAQDSFGNWYAVTDDCFDTAEEPIEFEE